jgi:23S rRNA (adenine2503-C2)-methyltransferase
MGDFLPMAEDDLRWLGLTQAEYAERRRTSTRAVRAEFVARMRNADGIALPPIVREERDGGVRKFCLAVPGPAGRPALETESVIIPMSNYHGGRWRTLCLSSQVGCRMGCTFCETSRMGLVRNLDAAEIVAQFVVARSLVAPQLAPSAAQYRYFASGLQNIVFMGMGEPLDNFDEVVQAIRVLAEPNGIAFPHAQITVSTVGRIDGLRRLAALGWPNLRIAISLNAANDELRNGLMPVNRPMPLAELRQALLDYPLAPRGLFLVEYVLLAGVNDSPQHAREVAAWCAGLRCVVNLIPYNPQRDAPYATPDESRVLAFYNELRRLGIFAKRRLTHGRDLMGACGQLGNPAIRRVRAAAPHAG